MRILFLLCIATSLSFGQLGPSGATASFRGALPPQPVADLTETEATALQKELETVQQSYSAVKRHPHAPDAEIFLKAVDYALRYHEWFDKKSADSLRKAHVLLKEAAIRIQSLQNGETPWRQGAGQKVLGGAHVDLAAWQGRYQH
jgi:hypothetical protein